jgi:protoheme IX farnesyltransferase
MVDQGTRPNAGTAMSDVPQSLGRLAAPARAKPRFSARSGLRLNLRSYLAVVDLRSSALLVFTALAAGVIGGGLHAPARLLGIGLALTLCCTGARAVANYVDRDIDALMERTRRRPLPSGAIAPSHALMLGFGLIAIGLAMAVPFGPMVVLLIALGLADNLIVYAMLTKRTSPLSIVLGAPSGGAPAFVGYVAVAGRIDLTAVLLATFVMLWTPIHIWSLAIRFKDDYARAGVPMLPVAAGVRRSARCIGIASLAFGALTMLFVLDGGVRLLPPVAALALGLAVGLLAASIWLMRSPTARNAWVLFKFTSPYLALLFVILALNAILNG